MSLNYNDMREKFPKSFEALLETLEVNLIVSDSCMDPVAKIILTGMGELQYLVGHVAAPFNDRDLHDFFDEKNILIYAKPAWGLNGAGAMVDIYNFRTYLGDDFGTYNSRREAEKAAFAKAFEILEQRLNQEK